ncbi:MAG: hypothetical protein AABY22_31110 [Nanoarchaeota archaeon]
MIFSIILIIAFLAVAGYAIVKFLDLGKTVKTNQFVNNLQIYVDELWQGSQGSVGKELNAPEGVTFVCFFDSSDRAKPSSNGRMYQEIIGFAQENENMVFYPLGSSNDKDYYEIKHVNITKTTEIKNPYCFENVNGKVSIILEKKFENNRLENLVTLR